MDIANPCKITWLVLYIFCVTQPVHKGADEVIPTHVLHPFFILTAFRPCVYFRNSWRHTN